MRKKKTEQSLSAFKTQKNKVNRLSDEKKMAFFNSAIANCSGNQKEIYKLLRRLTNKPTKPVYPEAPSDQVLANRFSDFFKSKIDNVNEQFTNTSGSQYQSQQPSSSCTCTFGEFSPVSQDELRKYIMRSPTKSCNLDPIPTFLLKECIDTTLPLLTDIVNRCLTAGYMPKRFKDALVSPIPKKTQDIGTQEFQAHFELAVPVKGNRAYRYR